MQRKGEREMDEEKQIHHNSSCSQKAVLRPGRSNRIKLNQTGSCQSKATPQYPINPGVNTLWRATYRRTNIRGDAEFMNWGLFESFCDLLENIPIKAVVRAADAERKMVEADLRSKRTEPDEYVVSVLGFCNFLTLAVRGNHPTVPGFPYEHRIFYASIVRKLVDAGELSPEFKGQFEEKPDSGREPAT